MNYRRNHLGGFQQRLWRQVSVALGHPNLGMPEEPLDHVERHTLIDQEAGERVTEIVQPHIGQTWPASDTVPGVEQLSKMMTAERRGEDVLATLHTRDRLQERDGCAIERDCSRLAGFRDRHQQGAPLPVHMLPFRLDRRQRRIALRLGPK
jgi:hypothetical protein